MSDYTYGVNGDLLELTNGTELLRRAEALAAAVHEGQRYGVLPYMYHVHGVAAAVRKFGTVFQIVAMLHDVLEESDMTVVALTAQGFPEVVTRAVTLLTKTLMETYRDYIHIIAVADTQPARIAQVVKIADLQFNLAHDPKPEKVPVYQNALEVLREYRSKRLLRSSVP